MIYYAYRFCENNYRSQHEAGIELREMLFSALNITDEVKVSESGRPYISSADIDFSVSHSKNMAVCAVIFPKNVPVSPDIYTIAASGHKIGVDAECIDPVPDISRLDRIARRYLNTEIGSADEFYTRWTRREAFGKLCGEGLFCRSDDKSCVYHTFTVELGDSLYKVTMCIQ